MKKKRKRIVDKARNESLAPPAVNKASLGEEHVQMSFPDMPAIPSVDTAIILADFILYAGHGNSESGRREQG